MVHYLHVKFHFAYSPECKPFFFLFFCLFFFFFFFTDHNLSFVTAAKTTNLNTRHFYYHTLRGVYVGDL